MASYPPAATVAGLALLAVGYLVRRHAYGLTKWNEILDAIGSKRSLGEVEPAGWNVSFTRTTGSALMVAGALVLLTAVVGFLQ